MIRLSRLGPHWPDHCMHGDECFVTSYVRKGKLYDLYVWSQPGRPEEQELCIRYGPEYADYISPGGLWDVLLYRHERTPVVRQAGEILVHHPSLVLTLDAQKIVPMLAHHNPISEQEYLVSHAKEQIKERSEERKEKES